MNNQVKEIINTDEYGFSTYTVKVGNVLKGCGIIDNKGNQLVKNNPEITKIERVTGKNSKTNGYKVINSKNPKGYTYFNIGYLKEKSKFLLNNKGKN